MNNQKINNEIGVANPSNGKFSRERFMFTIGNLVGTIITCRLCDNSVYKGVLYTTNPDELTIVLKCAMILKSPVPCKQLPRGSQIYIHDKDIISIFAEEMNRTINLFSYIPKVKKNDNNVKPKVDRELIKADAWLPEQTKLEALDETDNTQPFDQFKENEKKGIQSTYSIDMYTTHLDISNFTQEQVKEAARIENEILKNNSDNKGTFYEQYERGEIDEDSKEYKNITEEELFSSVTRIHNVVDAAHLTSADDLEASLMSGSQDTSVPAVTENTTLNSVVPSSNEPSSISQQIDTNASIPTTEPNPIIQVTEQIVEEAVEKVNTPVESSEVPASIETTTTTSECMPTDQSISKGKKVISKEKAENTRKSLLENQPVAYVSRSLINSKSRSHVPNPHIENRRQYTDTLKQFSQEIKLKVNNCISKSETSMTASVSSHSPDLHPVVDTHIKPLVTSQSTQCADTHVLTPSHSVSGSQHDNDTNRHPMSHSTMIKPSEYPATGITIPEISIPGPTTSTATTPLSNKNYKNDSLLGASSTLPSDTTPLVSTSVSSETRENKSNENFDQTNNNLSEKQKYHKNDSYSDSKHYNNPSPKNRMNKDNKTKNNNNRRNRYNANNNYNNNNDSMNDSNHHTDFNFNVNAQAWNPNSMVMNPSLSPIAPATTLNGPLTVSNQPVLPAPTTNSPSTAVMQTNPNGSHIMYPQLVNLIPGGEQNPNSLPIQQVPQQQLFYSQQPVYLPVSQYPLLNPSYVYNMNTVPYPVYSLPQQQIVNPDMNNVQNLPTTTMTYTQPTTIPLVANDPNYPSMIAEGMPVQGLQQMPYYFIPMQPDGRPNLSIPIQSNLAPLQATNIPNGTLLPGQPAAIPVNTMMGTSVMNNNNNNNNQRRMKNPRRNMTNNNGNNNTNNNMTNKN